MVNADKRLLFKLEKAVDFQLTIGYRLHATFFANKPTNGYLHHGEGAVVHFAEKPENADVYVLEELPVEEKEVELSRSPSSWMQFMSSPKQKAKATAAAPTAAPTADSSAVLDQLQQIMSAIQQLQQQQAQTASAVQQLLSLTTQQQQAQLQPQRHQISVLPTTQQPRAQQITLPQQPQSPQQPQHVYVQARAQSPVLAARPQQPPSPQPTQQQRPQQITLQQQQYQPQPQEQRQSTHALPAVNVRTEMKIDDAIGIDENAVYAIYGLTKLEGQTHRWTQSPYLAPKPKNGRCRQHAANSKADSKFQFVRNAQFGSGSDQFYIQCKQVRYMDKWIGIQPLNTEISFKTMFGAPPKTKAFPFFMVDTDKRLLFKLEKAADVTDRTAYRLHAIMFAAKTIDVFLHHGEDNTVHFADKSENADVYVLEIN